MTNRLLDLFLSFCGVLLVFIGLGPFVAGVTDLCLWFMGFEFRLITWTSERVVVAIALTLVSLFVGLN